MPGNTIMNFNLFFDYKFNLDVPHSCIFPLHLSNLHKPFGRSDDPPVSRPTTAAAATTYPFKYFCIFLKKPAGNPEPDARGPIINFNGIFAIFLRFIHAEQTNWIKQSLIYFAFKFLRPTDFFNLAKQLTACESLMGP